MEPVEVIFVEVTEDSSFTSSEEPVIETTTIEARNDYLSTYIDNTNLDGIWIGAGTAGILVMFSIGLAVFIKFFKM